MKNIKMKKEWLKKVKDVSKEYAIDKYKNCIPEHAIIKWFLNFCIEQECFWDFSVNVCESDNGFDVILEWRATDLQMFYVNIELVEWLSSETQKAMEKELVWLYQRLFYKMSLLHKMSDDFKKCWDSLI